MKKLFLFTPLVVCALLFCTSELPCARAQTPASEIIAFSQLDTPPVIKKEPKLRYRKKGVTGEVVLKFVVTKKGAVEGIVVSSFNDPDFIDAAYAAYEDAAFTPGKLNEEPVATRMEAKLVFPAK